jgi:predicted ribosome quality control (RQC) complex YloA/Tae2 family protein
MTRSLSNWEYRQLLHEAQTLVGQRFEKAYELGPGLFRLDFGKRSLMIGLGSYFYLTNNPPAGPQQPTSTAMQLRKHLDSQRLISFTAYQSDRIYILEFISGWKIVLEQFAGGNLFLLDEKGAIVRPYHYQPTSKRSYPSGSLYEWPPSLAFHLPPTFLQWKSSQADGPLTTLSAALSRWPIGKLYTQEALAQSGLDGKMPLSEVSDATAKALLQVLEQLLSKPTFLVYEKKAEPSDASTPVASSANFAPSIPSTNFSSPPIELSLAPLSTYVGSDYAAHEFSSWSEAVEFFFTHMADAARVPTKNPALIKLRHRLAEQETALLQIEKEIQAYEPTAQWLEAHLSAVEARLHELKSAHSSTPAHAHEKIDWKNKKLKLKIEE